MVCSAPYAPVEGSNAPAKASSARHVAPSGSITKTEKREAMVLVDSWAPNAMMAIINVESNAVMLRYRELLMVDIDQAWRLSRLCEGRGRSGLIWRRQTPPWERGSADCLQGYDRRVVGMDEDGMTGAHSYKAAA
jgi:hypothetical protein